MQRIRLVSFAAVIAAAVPARVVGAEHILPSPAPADTLGDRLRRELTPWLEERARTGVFSGVVVIARDGVPIYTAAHGLANRARNVPNTVDTRFNIGSMNKSWTAIAIAQLIEQGKIDLDATVGRYVPDLPNQAIRDQVKIRHLLSHTSGMGTYFRKGFLRDKVFANGPADYVSYYADDSLAFTPGARMRYSNAGFALLGLIVERVSGRPFYEYMKANVIDRAGMKSAAYVDVRSRPTDIAVGYGKPNGAPEAVENWDFIEQRSSPAGGAYASAADLVAFSRALWSGKLVGKALVDQFTTGQVAMGPQMQYAFGFGVGSIGRWRHVGHNGGIPGANAEFAMFPDQGIAVVVLANMDSPAATQVQMRIMSALTGVRLQIDTDDRPSGGPRAPSNNAPGATQQASSTQGAKLPDTIQGRRVAAFIEAYSKGTGEALEAFLRDHAVPRTDRTIQERVKGLEGIFDRTGKLTFKRFLGATNESVRALVQTEKDGEIQLIVSFEPVAPHRATLFNFEAGER